MQDKYFYIFQMIYGHSLVGNNSGGNDNGANDDDNGDTANTDGGNANFATDVNLEPLIHYQFHCHY